MLRKILLGCFSLLLAGCLETETPAFTDAETTAVEDNPRFMAFVEKFEAAGAPEEESPDSPRELIGTPARALDIGEYVLIQEPKPDEGKVDYYAVAVIGERAYACGFMADDAAAEIAAAYGVNVIESEDGMNQAMRVGGDAEKVKAFIRDQLETGPLICMSVKPGHKKTPG
jgi:hypothetical protein